MLLCAAASLSKLASPAAAADLSNGTSSTLASAAAVARTNTSLIDGKISTVLELVSDTSDVLVTETSSDIRSFTSSPGMRADCECASFAPSTSLAENRRLFGSSLSNSSSRSDAS
jgi:hypothetical protein